eukprot:8065273-Heterocapsa_arctica.AAC.1
MEASGKDEVQKEYKLYELLDRVMKVMELGQATQPSFHGMVEHGIVEGYDTDDIIATSNRRARMHIGRAWKGDSEQQFQWELSLWEKVFPRAGHSDEEEAHRRTILEPEEIRNETGRPGSDSRTNHQAGTQREANSDERCRSQAV